MKRFSGDAVRWRRPDPQTAPLSGHIPIGGLHLGVGHSNRCALAIISPSPVRISPIAHDFYNHVDFGAFRNEAIVMPPLFYHCPTNVYSMADRNRAFGGPTREGDHNAKPTKCMILTCLYGLQGSH